MHPRELVEDSAFWVEAALTCRAGEAHAQRYMADHPDEAKTWGW